MRRTPCTVVTGFLGVGKTSSILHLFRGKPPNERWAVLVNELGEVGIDGPILAADGVWVREIAGGCICCSAGLELQVALVRIFRDVKPERLLIEPTGVAHPATVLDVLRRPGLREVAEVRATITLVDPRHLANSRVRASEVWQDQTALADVLVANKLDLASPEDILAFRAFAAARWPPPQVVAEIERGALDPAWLDLRPGPEEKTMFRPLHLPREETTGWGFVWPPEVEFDRSRLRDAVQDLVAGHPALPAGLLRLKGIFRTSQGWSLVQADADAVRFTPSGWRSDSRVEVLAPPAPLDAQALREHFEEATLSEPSQRPP